MTNTEKHPNSTPTAPRKRLLPPVYFLAAVVVMVLLHLLIPVMHIIPGPWSLTGIALIILGIIPPLTGAVSFKNYGTTIKPFEISSALVTTGMHRYSRNPMYLGMVIILTDLAIALGTITPWIVIPLFVVVLTRRIIVIEEHMLSQRFGQAYTDYCKRVRRWV